MKSNIKVLIVILIASFGYSCFAQNLTVEWTNTIGGVGSEDIYGAIATDANDNVYVSGYYNGSADFDSDAINDFTSKGLQDAFVQKIDASGNTVWVKSMGGTGDDMARNIYVDANGNVFIAGYFSTSADFDGDAVNDKTSQGNRDIYIQKLDPNGNSIWVKTIGTTLRDWGLSIIGDASGNIYLGGCFEGAVDFDGDATTDLTSKGGLDVFVQKFDGNGSSLWVKQMGGVADDYIYDIDIDGAGNIYVAGNFTGSADFDGDGNIDITGYGSFDAYVQKLDANGNSLWVNNMGGTTDDEATGIAVDINGNVFVSGRYNGAADFDGVPGNDLTSNGAQDVFVQKLDANGNSIWVKSIGGATEDNTCSLNADSHGNIFFTGFFTGVIDYDSDGFNDLVSKSGHDVYVFKLDTDGSVVRLDSIQGFGNVQGRAIVPMMNGNGGYFIAGLFDSSADFDKDGSDEISSSGSFDIFVQKVAPCSALNSPNFPTVVDEIYCKGFSATQLQATADANHTLNWWGQDAIGGTPSGIAPIPATANAGTYTYYVSQVNNITTCESEREVINVYVIDVNVPTSTNVEYCYGSPTSVLTAEATTGFSLLWYGTNPSGNSSNVAPKPKSSISGITSYYVAQKHNTSSCESNKLAILVTVHDWPIKPTTRDTSICLFAKGVELPVDPLPNHSVVWWGKDEFGGTPTKVRLVPDVSVTGETTYFVAQQDNNTGCVSDRTPIVVSVIDNECENEPIQLMGVGPDIANIGSSYTYEVYVNDPTYNVNNLTYEWFYSGTSIGWDSISPSVQNVYFYNNATEGNLYCVVYGFSEEPDTIKWEITLVENLYYNFLKPLKCPEVKASLVETYLDEVSFINTNIKNVNSGRASSGYADYTALFTDPPLYYWGEVMHIELVAKSINSNKNYFGIFIDFNNNGSFGDEGDFVDYSDGLDVLTYTSSRVKLPDTSLAGNNSVCRVRVIVSPDRAINANDSCISNNFKGEVEDYLIRIEYNTKLSASNLLTPNNDTKNDVFVVHGLVPGELNRLAVFNRTGKLVYEKEGYDNTWEGLDNDNNPLPEGNYYYVIVTGNNKLKGFLEIIRD